MVTQLLQHERICTTLPKAQALQRFADRVITLGKRVRGSRGLVYSLARN
jgi:ribosomal protein L17